MYAISDEINLMYRVLTEKSEYESSIACPCVLRTPHEPFDRSALSAHNEDIKVRYCRVGSGAASFCASATISVLL